MEASKNCELLSSLKNHELRTTNSLGDADGSHRLLGRVCEAQCDCDEIVTVDTRAAREMEVNS